MAKTEREISFDVLYDVYSKDSFSNITLNNHLKDEEDKRKQNFVRELVYGVLENYLLIDYIVSKASKIKMKKIHSSILIILRMGIYQILFMDNVPDSAAVNESVKLSKKHGNRGSIGFVNGTLRNISKNKEQFKTVNIEDDTERLSISYSHPKWLVEMWINDYGIKFTEEMLIANNKKPELNIRVNTLKTNKMELTESLNKKGFIVKEGILSNNCLIIENPFKISQIEEFVNGHFTIQDESSSLVADIMDPKPGSKVIDICSAPGGKSTHIAEKMQNKGEIIARDIYEHKIRLIDQNAKRLGIDIIKTEVFDALELDDNLIDYADYVLVDAPCSGLGLIRRKPEIKKNKVESDIITLSSIQLNILDIAKEYLKVGGILIYSTCTLSKRENLDLVREFLKKNSNFNLVNIENTLGEINNIPTLKDGYLNLYPHIQGSDGFFIAKLEKHI